jgi:hypothetical protein
MVERDPGGTDGNLIVSGVILSEEPVMNAEAGLIAEIVEEFEGNWLWNVEIRLKYGMKHEQSESH